MSLRTVPLCVIPREGGEPMLMRTEVRELMHASSREQCETMAAWWVAARDRKGGVDRDAIVGEFESKEHG